MTQAQAQTRNPYAYAAEVRERNKPDCNCETCRRDRLLPMVVQMTERWPVAARKVRRIK